MWLDGTYGPSDHRRQRFRCIPLDGSRWHRFTEPLPRLAVRDKHECGVCERVLRRFEGPQSPRQIHYTAREIARALVRVGAGETYWRASRLARLRGEDPRIVGLRGEGHLVADWVELFAPVVAAP